MQSFDPETAVLTLIHEYEYLLPLEDITDCDFFARHSEWGVSLELLCTRLYERDVPLTMGSLSQLEALGERLRINLQHVALLRERAKR
jgi:hypothetical protein